MAPVALVSLVADVTEPRARLHVRACGTGMPDLDYFTDDYPSPDKLVGYEMVMISRTEPVPLAAVRERLGLPP